MLKGQRFFYNKSAEIGLKERFQREKCLEKANMDEKKPQLYDVCHHCKRVVADGELIAHLKNECLPRRKRIVELIENQNPINLITRKQNQLVSCDNPQQQYRQRNKSQQAIRQVKHKIFSPWTLQMSKNIRQHIIPTRSIIIGQQDE